MTNAAKQNYIVTTVDEFFNDYTVTTLDEFFGILDRDEQRRTKMIAKSLKKYLKSTTSLKAI